MIKQEHRGLKFTTENEFWITGGSRDQVFSELHAYAKQNPRKWIYYHEDRVRPAKGIPLPEWCLEIHLAEKKPSSIMLYRLYQKGCEGLEEEMTPDIINKQLLAFSLMGQCL